MWMECTELLNDLGFKRMAKDLKRCFYWAL